MDRWVWLGAAALALLAGLVAVLAFTGGEAGSTPLAYGVEWPVEEGPSTVEESELEEGRNETHTFELARANVTHVTVTLTWSDDVGQPDEFRLAVHPPNGTEIANASRNETIEIGFPLASPPQLDLVEAANRSQARERVAEEASEAGQGTWEVVVSLADAPGRRPVPGADLETEPDGSNTYNLTFSHRAFYAEIGEAVPPEPG